MRNKGTNTDSTQVRSVFATRLRDIRRDRGYTQYQLARLCGISERYIGRYESGRSIPSSVYLLRLAKALGVSPNYLLGEDDAQQA